MPGLGPGRHPPLQPGWVDAPHHHVSLGDFGLESGESIQGCHVTYVVHGPQRGPGLPAAGVPVVALAPVLVAVVVAVVFVVVGVGELVFE